MGRLLKISDSPREGGFSFTYEISARDRILAVNGCDRGKDGTSRNLLFRSLWDVLGNGNIADIYRLLVRQVRTERRTLRLHIRCDEPDTRRLLVLTMEPLAGGTIRFSSRPVEIEPQSPLEFFHRHQRVPAEVDICGGCGGVDVSGEWLPADQALERLRLFSDDLDFRTRSCTCPACRTGDGGTGDGHAGDY